MMLGINGCSCLEMTAACWTGGRPDISGAIPRVFAMILSSRRFGVMYLIASQLGVLNGIDATVGSVGS